MAEEDLLARVVTLLEDEARDRKEEAKSGKAKSSGKGSGDLSEFSRSISRFTGLTQIAENRLGEFNKSVNSTGAQLTFLQAAVTSGAAKQSQVIEQLASKKNEINQFKKEVEALEISSTRLLKSKDAEDQAEGERLAQKLAQYKAEGKLDDIIKQEAQLRRQNLTFQQNYFPNLAKEYFTYNGIVKDAGKALAGASSFALKQAGSLMNSGDMFGPVQAGFEAGVDILNKGSQGAAKGMQNVGAAMMTVPGPTMAVGAVVTALGTVIGGASEAVSKLAKEGFGLMVEQTKKLISSFNQMSASGALFADGMTGMINAAGKSGLTVDQFSKVVAGNTDNMIMFGGSVSGGIKKLGEVTGRFSEDAKRQMLNLGFSFEEQASFTAEYMDGLARSGKLAGKSQTDLANESVKYMTSLRVISSITGEDAKKAQARAKAASEQAAVQAKLSEMGPDAMAKYQQMVKMYGAEYEGAIGQLVTTGAVTGDAAVALAQMPTMAAQLQSGVEDIGNSSVDLTRAQRNQISAMNSGAAATKEEALAASKTVGLASQYGKGYQEASKMFSGALRNASRAAEDGFATAGTAAEDQAKTQDVTTTNLTNAGIAAQDLQLKLQALVVEVLPGFSSIVEKIMTGYNDVFDAIRKALGLSGKTGTDVVGAEAKKLRDAKTAAIAAGGPNAAKTVSDIIQQEQQNLNSQTKRLSQRDAKDLLASPHDATFAEILKEYGLTEAQLADLAAGKAKKLGTGGITNGLSFAGESGPEAVIPLPDGKSVPVAMQPSQKNASPENFADSVKSMLDDVAKSLKPDTAQSNQSPAMAPAMIQFNNEILSSIKSQTDILTANMAKYDLMIRALQDSANIQKGILNATM